MQPSDPERSSLSGVAVTPEYPSPPPTSRDQLPPSGPGAGGRPWPRVGARVIDLFLTWFVPALILLRPYLPTQAGETIDLSKIPLWIPLVLAVLPSIYEFVMLGIRGQTVGKMLVGVRVVRWADGGKLTWSQAGMRVVVPLVPAAIGLAIAAVSQVASLVQVLIYATAFVDPTWRGLHDKAASTIVLRVR